VSIFGAVLASAQTGTIVTFDVPGSTGTTAYSINKHGAIVGYYEDQNGAQHGFFRAPIDRAHSVPITAR
jgi:probable HAF family extracellular repeat protein